MKLLIATLILDVQLQARSKLYVIGIAVAILLGLAGRFFVPEDYAGRVMAAFYLTGIGGTTYFFGASLVLFEKSQGTLQAIRVTPLTALTYIASKVITLSSFALLESVIIYLIAFLGVSINPLPMIFGVLSLGVVYTLVGLGQVASYDSVTAFLFPGAAFVSGILGLPVLYLINVALPFIWLIPTQSSLLLMLGATETLPSWQWFYAITVSLTSIVLASLWARSQFTNIIGFQED